MEQEDDEAHRAQRRHIRDMDWESTRRGARRIHLAGGCQRRHEGMNNDQDAEGENVPPEEEVAPGATRARKAHSRAERKQFGAPEASRTRHQPAHRSHAETSGLGSDIQHVMKVMTQTTGRLESAPHDVERRAGGTRMALTIAALRARALQARE